MTFALEQDAERLEHIGLVIGDQDSAHGITMNRISGARVNSSAENWSSDALATSLGAQRACAKYAR